MPRKKKESRSSPTVDEVRSLREQAEGHIFEVILQFEEITGLEVTGVQVSRRKPAGFGTKEVMEVNLITHI